MESRVRYDRAHIHTGGYTVRNGITKMVRWFLLSINLWQERRGSTLVGRFLYGSIRVCSASSKNNVQELVGCGPDQSGKDYLLVKRICHQVH